jgi:hypothetical protein
MAAVGSARISISGMDHHLLITQTPAKSAGVKGVA